MDECLEIKVRVGNFRQFCFRKTGLCTMGGELLYFPPLEESRGDLDIAKSFLSGDLDVSG